MPRNAEPTARIGRPGPLTDAHQQAGKPGGGWVEHRIWRPGSAGGGWDYAMGAFQGPHCLPRRAAYGTEFRLRVDRTTRND